MGVAKSPLLSLRPPLICRTSSQGCGVFFESYLDLSHQKLKILKDGYIMMIRFLVMILLVLTFAAETNAANVYFDVSHRVIFQPDSDKKLGLKSFVSLFEQRGDKVYIKAPDFNGAKELRPDLIVLPGTMKQYSPKEIDQIESFVSDGGNLLVLLHIAPTLARVTERFGIILSNAVISETENLIDGKSQDFYAKDIVPHPVTKGVSSVALYGTWGMMAEKGAKIVAYTGDKAFMDFNRNRVRDKDEPGMKVGLVAVSEYGSGKVVVVADDAPLANAFLGMGDNLKLAENIVSWLTE